MKHSSNEKSFQMRGTWISLTNSLFIKTWNKSRDSLVVDKGEIRLSWLTFQFVQQMFELCYPKASGNEFSQLDKNERSLGIRRP